MPSILVPDVDPDTHIYTVKAKVWPGVTEIIKAAGMMGSAVAFFTDRRREEGKLIHACCKLLFENNLDSDTVDPSIKLYVESCAKWIDHSKFKPRRLEHSLAHPELEYCGTWDADGDTQQIDKLLFDLKSGVCANWHGVQTAAYTHLANREKKGSVERRASLYLQSDGSMAVLKEHTDLNDTAIFYYALKSWHMEKALEQYRRGIEKWRSR